MLRLSNVALAALIIVAPVLANAQSSTTQILTRADVRANLVQIEQAGYKPYANDPLYPLNLRRAEAVIAAQKTQINESYGPDANGTIQSGH